jgi:hypothetical protein
MWSMIQRTHSIFIRRCTLTIIISWLKSNEEFETLNCTQQHHNSKQKQVNNLLKILSLSAVQAPRNVWLEIKTCTNAGFHIYIFLTRHIVPFLSIEYSLRREANIKNCGVLTNMVVQLDNCSKAQKMCNYILQLNITYIINTAYTTHTHN